jgi:hypothetical protein
VARLRRRASEQHEISGRRRPLIGGHGGIGRVVAAALAGRDAAELEERQELTTTNALTIIEARISNARSSP